MISQWQHHQEPIWVYPEENAKWTQKIIQEFNIHPVMAQILVSRGFTVLEDIHHFLYAKLPNLFSPNLFRDMDKAVARIQKALARKEKILIYGDNDVDGMTAAALLTEFFREIGLEAFYYIPNTSFQKKGIFGDALTFALQAHCTLLITVDCGITAAQEIQNVVSQNIDVIVTDHHEPTSKIPHCIATLNPKLVNSTYPNREITGVGVAFKLAHAVTNFLIDHKIIPDDKINLKSYLDLVALGTISDMGSLLGENRILVRYGLQELQNTRRIGLLQLFKLCDLKAADITPMDIASKVAPRLNSLGRIADPMKGVELLLIKDKYRAATLAKQLDQYNVERQRIEREASLDIENFIKNHPKLLSDKALVLHSNKWHPGIIPIIAARLAKQYNRPALLIAIEKDLGKGSIRTIPEFPLLWILKKHQEHLVNFGGHDYACGLLIKKDNIAIFRTEFIKEANKILQDLDVISKLYLDAPVQFDDLTFDFMESLKLLEPYGNENPPPVLYTDAKQPWVPKTVGKIHLKIYLEQKDKILEGIGFNLSWKRRFLAKKDSCVRVAFTPVINTFQNKTSIQLQIRDLKLTQ
ncbi:MAG: single-stranded-DNA-specific exonuclease RecJ [Parachlamydiales bacterium]|nr:single-stranded-DNA-specific exonuclease RecJ [Parachlamydiales bacterium]